MKTRVALVLALAAATITGCKTARMKPVAPIEVSYSTPEQTRDIVRKALIGRHWALVDEKPGAIHAMQSGGEWSVAIDVTYDADSVEIRYADSSNLKYHKTKKGRESIHKNYNLWMKHLANDIRMMGRHVKKDT